MLKSRFRALERKCGGGIQYNCETAVYIIMAYCVLNNYCRLRNMDFEIYKDIAKSIAEDSRLRRFHEPETLGLGSGAMIYII